MEKNNHHSLCKKKYSGYSRQGGWTSLCVRPYNNEQSPTIDEHGNRYATFSYNQNGKAILSELGTTTSQLGQERVSLDHQIEN